MTHPFSDELTPATVWDAGAVAGVLALMLPPWLAVTAAVIGGAVWVLPRVHPAPPAEESSTGGVCP